MCLICNVCSEGSISSVLMVGCSNKPKNYSKETFKSIFADDKIELLSTLSKSMKMQDRQKKIFITNASECMASSTDGIFSPNVTEEARNMYIDALYTGDDKKYSESVSSEQQALLGLITKRCITSTGAAAILQ